MAFFSDTVFDEETGRHERLFVNSWNEKVGDYALNVTPEEALRIARGSGGNWFDVEEARAELPAKDHERAAKR